MRGGELFIFGGFIWYVIKVFDKFGFKINVNYMKGNEFKLDFNDFGDVVFIVVF